MIRHIKKINNFSYKIVDTDVYILIPLEQQMSVYQEQEIVDTGELDIEGELVIYE